MNITIQLTDDGTNFLKLWSANGEDHLNDVYSKILSQIIAGVTRRDLDPERYNDANDHWGNFHVDLDYITDDFKERSVRAKQVIEVLDRVGPRRLQEFDDYADHLEVLAKSIRQVTRDVAEEQRKIKHAAKETAEYAALAESLNEFKAAGHKREAGNFFAGNTQRGTETNLAVGDVLRLGKAYKKFWANKISGDVDYNLVRDGKMSEAEFNELTSDRRFEAMATSDNDRPWLKFVVSKLDYDAKTVEAVMHIDVDVLKSFTEADYEDDLMIPYRSNVGSILPTEIGKAWSGNVGGGRGNHRNVTHFIQAADFDTSAWMKVEAADGRTVYISKEPAVFKTTDNEQRKAHNYPQGTVFNGSFRIGHNNRFDVLVHAAPNEAVKEVDRSF